MKRSTLPAPTGHAFLYGELPASVRKHVEAETEVIRRLLAKTARNIVQIGLRLKLVHAAIGRDRFQQWLRAEFCWSQSLASKYMRSAAVFGHFEHLERFQPSALYVLAQHRCPAAARQEALDRAQAGELITKSRAEMFVSRHRRGGERSRTSAAAIRKTARKLAEQLANLDDADLRSVADELDRLAERLRSTLPATQHVMDQK